MNNNEYGVLVVLILALMALFITIASLLYYSAADSRVFELDMARAGYVQVRDPNSSSLLWRKTGTVILAPQEIEKR